MADLQTLINAIPDAQDGNLITSDYHNTIKTALEAIAVQLGNGTSGQSVALALQPNFLPVGKNPQWNISIGVAQDSPGTATNGWIPLHLPDGAQIQQLVVYGSKVNPTSGPATIGFVSLVIQPIGGTGATTLILIDLSNAGNPFQLTGTPLISGLTPSALKDMETVQNANFKYAVNAEVLEGTPGGSVSIFALQVVYGKP